MTWFPLLEFSFFSVLNMAGQPYLPGSSEFSALASASISQVASLSPPESPKKKTQNRLEIPVCFQLMFFGKCLLHPHGGVCVSKVGLMMGVWKLLLKHASHHGPFTGVTGTLQALMSNQLVFICRCSAKQVHLERKAFQICIGC